MWSAFVVNEVGNTIRLDCLYVFGTSCCDIHKTNWNVNHWYHFDGLVQGPCNSSALAMELYLSYTSSSIYQLYLLQTFVFVQILFCHFVLTSIHRNQPSTAVVSPIIGIHTRSNTSVCPYSLLLSDDCPAKWLQRRNQKYDSLPSILHENLMWSTIKYQILPRGNKASSANRFR